MESITSIERWRSFAEESRRAGRSIGLVATMGALHAGHESLIAAARRECDVVIVTIFVNPRQFNDASDLTVYPRTPEADLERCAHAGADAVVTPSLSEMWPEYPAPTATTVSVRGVSDLYEGADRPGHFDGVASVVAKLFAITGACRAYFGDKDFQQLAVVRAMARDLSLPVTIVGCPIVRDVDGLALSSRNLLLSAESRGRALALARAIESVCDGLQRPVSEIVRLLHVSLDDADVDVAYAVVVDPITLRELDDSDAGPARVLIAGIVDGVRLLDNGEVTVCPSKGVNSAAGY